MILASGLGPVEVVVVTLDGGAVVAVAAVVEVAEGRAVVAAVAEVAKGGAVVAVTAAEVVD